jgi:hypothetical protein
LHELADKGIMTGIRADRPVVGRRENGLSVSPNPCRGLLRVSAQGGARGRRSVALYDAVGKTRRVLWLADGAGTEVDLSDLPDGAYFLSVSGTPWSTARVMVLR